MTGPPESAEFAEALRRLAQIQAGSPVGGCGSWKANLVTGRWIWSDTLASLIGRAGRCPAMSLDEGLRLFAADFQPKVLQALRGAWQGGTAFVMEAELTPEPGRHAWVEIVCGGRIGSDQELWLTGTLQDITARRSAADAAERYRIHLEERVAAKTLELQHARIAGQAAQRAKSRFLANMSHELRTPLNAITGFAYLLRPRLTDPKALEQLQRVTEAAEHLLEMIEDVLDFARLEAETVTLETADFVLENVLATTTQPLVGRASAKGLEIVFDVDSALSGTLRGDPLRLGQVLRNLIENAVKFTVRGAVLLTASKADETEADLAVRFEVRDTGIGLPVDKQAGVFGVFEQVDDSTTRRYGGMGMGLAISRELVSLMGGELGVESRPGGGSAFWFTARFRKGGAGAPARPALVQLAGRRALVADAQVWVREALAKMLAALGLRVEAAESGTEVLAKMQYADRMGDPFDVVLIDSDLPTGDAGSALGEIVSLKLETSPAFLILMVFGKALTLADAQAAGFRSILHKPFTLTRLDKCVAACLGGSGAAEIASADPKPG